MLDSGPIRTQNHAKTALIPANNLQHNVPARLAEARRSLAALAELYFRSQVAGQAGATIDAKRRDLGRFLSFYQRLYGHDHPAEWYVSVTREFLKQLAKARPAQATVVRTYASVRHFARWVHQKVVPFPLGCPTHGIKPPQEAEPQWRGLSRADELRLLNAAQTLRVRPGRGTPLAVAAAPLHEFSDVPVDPGHRLRAHELQCRNCTMVVPVQAAWLYAMGLRHGEERA